jgi:hypothetical protein
VLFDRLPEPGWIVQQREFRQTLDEWQRKVDQCRAQHPGWSRQTILDHLWPPEHSRIALIMDDTRT